MLPNGIVDLVRNRQFRLYVYKCMPFNLHKLYHSIIGVMWSLCHFLTAQVGLSRFICTFM